MDAGVAAKLALARKVFGGSRATAEGGGLDAFIPKLTPGYVVPKHLAPLIRELERAQREPVRIVCHAPPRHGKPLGKDTAVTMADGTQRPISALCVGDRVVSGFGRVTTVTAVYDQGRLLVSRVTTLAGRSFLAEASHRFLTQDGWKRVDGLRPYAKKNWQRPRGDMLMVGAQYATEPSEMDLNVARFLGYMAGDGNTTQRNCRWTNVDPPVRASFTEVVRALGGDVSTHDAQTLGVRCTQRVRPTDRHHLKALLDEHGLDGKLSIVKTVPRGVYAAQDEAVAAFLGAYFECDGTRGVDAGERGASAAFYSVSREMLAGCQHLLARLGVRSSLLVKRGRYKGAVHLSWQLTVLDQARFFDVIPIVGAKSGPKMSSRRHERDRHLPDTVASVEPAGEEHCYCITVADDESFLAEGLVTHNTESVLAAIAWYLTQDPKLICGYATYGADLSYSKSRSARAFARAAGVELASDAQGVKEWRTKQGGGLLATGVGGPFTGFGVNRLFVDDPFKNRLEAESASHRQRVLDWWRDVAFTRLEPNASAVVFATRWHPDDLSGELIRQGWKYIRLPAVDDHGAALWPMRYDTKALAEIRSVVGEYTWASLYQGLPRPRGGSVFNATPATYTADALAEILKNPRGWIKAIGADFAYSRRTSADHSAAVAGLGFIHEGQRIVYVLDTLRRQLDAPSFAVEAAKLQAKHNKCKALAYTSTTEMGVAALMAGFGFDIEAKLAVADKFTRAQPYAASWNGGRVLLPADVEPDSWVNVFLAEHLNFTGSNDKADDQVDAGAAMHDVIAGSPLGVGPPPPPRILHPDSAPMGW